MLQKLLLRHFVKSPSKLITKTLEQHIKLKSTQSNNENIALCFYVVVVVVVFFAVFFIRLFFLLLTLAYEPRLMYRIHIFCPKQDFLYLCFHSATRLNQEAVII